MPLEFGRSGFVKLGKETTYGTGVSGTVSNRIVSASLAKTQERARKTYLSHSSAAFQSGHFDGFTIVGGTIDLPLLYDGSGMLLYAALGAQATTDNSPATPQYQHDYTASADLPSLTVYLQRGTGKMEEFLGCMVNSLTISGAAGEEVMMSVDLVAQNASSRTSAITASYGTGTQVFHYQNTTNYLTFNAANYPMKSFELTIDNKLERRQVLGSKLTLEPAIADVREVTISATFEMLDDNLYNAFLAGTTSDLVITFDSTAANIVFTLKNAYIQDYSDPVNTFGPLERTVTFVGESDNSNEAVNIQVNNASSSAIGN
jgi:hypothetical protein